MVEDPDIELLHIIIRAVKLYNVPLPITLGVKGPRLRLMKVLTSVETLPEFATTSRYVNRSAGQSDGNTA